MNAFDAYRKYCALKAHFTTKSYDYIKHNGAVRVTAYSFNKRSDQDRFYQLSKHKDPEGLIIANASVGNFKWVGDLLIDDKEYAIYNDWIRRRDSLTYLFKSEIKKLNPDFNKNFDVKNGQHPYLLQLYRQKHVSIETMVILNSILSFIPMWDKRIEETIVWPNISMLIKKYTPFVNFNFGKMKNILVEHAKNVSDEQ